MAVVFLRWAKDAVWVSYVCLLLSIRALQRPQGVAAVAFAYLLLASLVDGIEEAVLLSSCVMILDVRRRCGSVASYFSL